MSQRGSPRRNDGGFGPGRSPHGQQGVPQGLPPQGLPPQMAQQQRGGGRSPGGQRGPPQQQQQMYDEDGYPIEPQHQQQQQYQRQGHDQDAWDKKKDRRFTTTSRPDMHHEANNAGEYYGTWNRGLFRLGGGGGGGC